MISFAFKICFKKTDIEIARKGILRSELLANQPSVLLPPAAFRHSRSIWLSVSNIKPVDR